MFTLWKLTDTLSLCYKFDELSKVFLILAVVLWGTVTVYSIDYLHKAEHKARYYIYLAILFVVMVLMSVSGNFITFYMNYELMTLTSVPLVMQDQTLEARMAGFKYLFYSFAGAYSVLFGFFILNSYFENLNFVYGGHLDLAAINGHEGLILLAVFMMIIGFGVKGGMWPMHAWLTTAHPIAPAPASALLSGIVVKAGVAGIIRVIYYLVGPDFIRGTWVQYAFMTITLLTVLMGSTLAYFEPVLKRRLAYSTISQVSYILFGLSVLNDVSLEGGYTQFLAHGFSKCALFLVAGALIHVTGETEVDKMEAIGKKYPLLTWCYLIAALSMIGIPPTGGFIAKWWLCVGSLEGGIPVFAWLGPVILLVSALLTAGYLLPLALRGFFPGDKYEVPAEYEKVSKLMLWPIAVLVILCVVMGLIPNVFIG